MLPFAIVAGFDRQLVLAERLHAHELEPREQLGPDGLVDRQEIGGSSGSLPLGLCAPLLGPDLLAGGFLERGLQLLDDIVSGARTPRSAWCWRPAGISARASTMPRLTPYS